jgi:multimeric flavodoxin WrbA
MSSVIIVGSSRSDGNTAKLAEQFSTQICAEVVDLSSYNILPYDYKFKNQDDDFLPLIDRLLTFDSLIFASPIYWYSPSGTMKLFLDRLCDLLDIYKPRGRALKSKTAGVLATGAAQSAPDCFEQIFSNTFEYFDMSYIGMFYSQFSGTEDSAKQVIPITINK